MASPQSLTKKPQTLTLDSSHLFHSSLRSLSSLSAPKLPLSFPPIPPDFPQCKIIPNTRFLVDAFRHSGDYSVAYFLSHFHSDHYTGLSATWSKGIVFCSDTTARLLIQVLKVPSPFVVALPLRKPALIDGSEVTLVDANHCPGAVQFLFRVPGVNGRFERYVHTGDFRFCDSMKSEPVLAEFVGSDAIFLDTTYCNPKFLFPSQEESIDYIVSVIERTAGEYAKGSLSNVLFIVATYVVGKEKILVEIARRCKRKVHVNARKFEVLRVLGYAESGVFTEDHTETDVHVVGWNVLGETWPYFRPNFVRMKEIMEERKCSKVVGFVPTGWTYEMKQNKFPVRTKDSFDIHLVPYSEHSNYEELREYVKFLKPKRVIPTVGSGIEKLDSKHVNKMQKYFAGLVDEIANKQEFLMGFHRGCGDIDNKVKEVDDSDQNEVLQAKETRLLDVKDPESRDAGFTLDCPSPLQELGEQDLTKVIEELRESLPTWVTRDQMLDLISSSGRNIVDAVSNFYDNETKFHEQAFSCSISCSTSQTNSRSDSVSFLKPDLLETSPFGSTDIPFSQKLKASNTKPLIKNIASPGKKKGSTASKPNKKAKLNSKLNSSGKGQTSITKFFNKVVPNASLDGRVESESDQYPKGETSEPSDASKLYKDEIDQFVRIVNGDESLKSYAATIVGKTTGDLNMALNLHYGNSAGDLEKNEKRLVVCANSDQPQCIVSNSMGDHVRTKKNLGHLANLSVQGLSSENVNATLVSLPSEKYNPIEHACWKSGQHAPYIHLARTFDLVEGERGKTKATSMMCNMFRSLLALSPEDVLPAVYLCTNKIAADHENMELNIGGSLVTAALEEACGMNRSKIRDMYNSLGDLGDVAQVCRQTQSLLAHPSPLLIKDVFSVLRKISVQTGSGSTARKKSLIVNLMRSCREMEMKFLVRTLVKNLRIGAMIRTVLPALAQAVVVNFSSNFHHEETAESLKEKLQRLSVAVVEAYNILPDLDLVVPSLLKEGIGFSSSTLSIVPGIPIKPMLAKITNGVPQALRLFQNKAFTCEYKYDGQRAQIHKLVDGSIRVFSRSGEEATARFPDVINIIKESCKPAAHTFILDSEVVAVDRKNGCKLMSFQELSSRERGSKDSIISVDSIKVDICVFIFDIMFANGEQLLGSPLRRRRQYFMDLFCNEKLGYFEYAKKITIEANDACLTNEATLTKMSSFLEDAFHSSCEGIIVKSLDVDAGYTPSKRSNTWLKVKRDYVEGLNDSVDLVPIGAWHGNGRKAGWYSPFLMACYNPETEEFQSVCRVMSGFSDSFYKEMKEFFCGDKILSKKPSYYRTAEGPDMWFSPEVVWEIRGADFTVSSVHQAAVGLVHPSRGISIRFPRFIRCVSDRNPEECSTAADMAEMFFSQTRRKDVMVED